MAQMIEAIYSHGVLRPLTPLQLPEQQKVRVTVEIPGELTLQDRAVAIKRMQEGFERSTLYLTGPLPSRDELHERR